jgi:hypothetical protein
MATHTLNELKNMSASQLPLRYDMDVPPDGRIELQLPLPTASHVTVYVVEAGDTEFDDLIAASASSLDFWDNSEDDEDWNDA